MTDFLNQIIQGLLLGGYYALIGSGLAFMFNVMGVINLAHGSLVILTAFLLFSFADRLGIQPSMGVIAVMPIVAALSAALQRFVFDKSPRGNLLVPVLASFGLSIVSDNLLFQIYGADTKSLAPFEGSLSYDSWSLSDDIDIGKFAVFTFLIALVFLGSLQLLLRHTHLGRAIRATAIDADTAGLVGIDAGRNKAAAAALASIGVCLAAFALGVRATFDPYAGAPQLLFAFEATVIGGASLWGTLFGGIVLGIAQSLGSLFSPQGFLIAGHVVFLGFLFARLWLRDANRR